VASPVSRGAVDRNSNTAVLVPQMPSPRNSRTTGSVRSYPW
jgi:hypothetical protein